jgi:hypothetical protein
MAEIDYSEQQGCADEKHWRDFVESVGGELIDTLITTPGVEQADFLFRKENVVIELKVLETEFMSGETMQKRIGRAFSSHPGSDPGDPHQPLRRELLTIFGAPLQRIVKKANRQIRSTVQELGLSGAQGLVVCVNNNFRAPPPMLVMGLLCDALGGAHYNSIHGLIYQTNHYVELPTSPYAHLLWVPAYSERANEALVSFVDNLGRKWRQYAEAVDGPFDVSEEGPSANFAIRSALVVRGPRRQFPFVDGDP